MKQIELEFYGKKYMVDYTVEDCYTTGLEEYHHGVTIDTVTVYLNDDDLIGSAVIDPVTINEIELHIQETLKEGN